MKISSIVSSVLLLMVSVAVSYAAEESLSDVRMPIDSVGYATTPSQVEAIINLCDSLESESYFTNEQRNPIMLKRDLIAAICPHDDYLYAGPVYLHVMREVRAPVIIMFGVSHHARHMGIEGKLVFEPQHIIISGSTGITHYDWDGRDKENKLLPLGLYICFLEIIEIDSGHKKTAKAPIVIGAPLD